MTKQELEATDMTEAAKLVVLFVVAEPQTCKFFAKFLGDSCLVVVAGDSATGKKLVAEHDEHIAVIVYDLALAEAEMRNSVLAWAAKEYPDVVRVLCSSLALMDVAIDAVTSGKVYRFLELPWDIPSLKATIQEALDHYTRVTLLGETTSVLSKKANAKATLAAPPPPSASSRLSAAKHDKRQTTFRVVVPFLNGLKKAAEASGFDSYSVYLDQILRAEFKTLKNEKKRIGDVRTRHYRKQKMKTVTFFLSHTLVRTYHTLAYQLGYPNTSQLINEILERNVIDEGDEDTRGF